MLATPLVGKEAPGPREKRWDPDHGDHAWAPFKSDRQLERFLRNEDFVEGDAPSWKVT
jgi:hypothetical protein